MSRLPLSVNRDGPTSERLMTVSELTGQVRAVLQADFADVGLTGEITGLSRPRSGHVYLSLKDDSAQIRAVMWKSTAQKLAFDLDNGLAVRAWGSLEVYAPRGDYQIILRKIEPEGIGALELAFRQVVARLEAEGLFEPERKRPLPLFPGRIVVISSPTGAAIRDFVQVVGRRWPMAEILIAPAKVQGQGAAEEVAEAIALANTVAGADFVVLARGGGSLEDLWAFNEEVVARAIFASRLPVVSAIGHEVDVTVSDLVADVRALTPTDAASRCVPDLAELRVTLDLMGQRMARAVSEPIRRTRIRLDTLSDRADRAFELRLGRVREKLTHLSDRATCAIRLDLDRREQSLGRLAAQLEALSPLKVLSRGYSLTLKDDDVTVLRSADEVQVGDVIHTRLASGTLVSRVISK
ncbi:MAG: exodeoxyribonuclease large subunit [Planctomycetota bacterium]|nr:exodeoxyribonuclease large subunit [Planctomycetota bacterium]